MIEARTTGGEQDNLLNATEILAGLRFDRSLLRALFRRGTDMIESPVLQEWFAERDIKTRQTIVLETLESRFGAVPSEVSAAVRVVKEEPRLKAIQQAAATASSLDTFRQSLTAANTPTN